MARKYVTLAVGAVGAGVEGPRVPVATPDDQSPRRVTGIKCTNVTKGVQVILDTNGTIQATLDLAALGQLTEFADLDYTVPVNIQVSAAFNNTTAGAIVAGDFLTIRYEV